MSSNPDVDEHAGDMIRLFLKENPRNKVSFLRTTKVVFTEGQFGRLYAKGIITAEETSQVQSYIRLGEDRCILNIPNFSTSTLMYGGACWVGVGAYAFSMLSDPMAAFYITLAHTGTTALITGMMVQENGAKVQSLKENEKVELARKQDKVKMEEFADQLHQHAVFMSREKEQARSLNGDTSSRIL